MSVMSLITETGFVAKLVLLILLAASIVCWSIIISKWKKLKIAQNQNAKFNAIFWNGKNVDDIVTKSEKFPDSPIAIVFKSGMRELRRFSALEPALVSGFEKIDNIQRALIRASNEQISELENHLSWLATTASAAPFVGLFGTVWGIMNSFHSIAATGSANLAVVAPGISEALITTATGIGAAIPAVVAYNYFVGEVKKVALDIESFSQDFLNIIQRSSSKKGGSS
ncbi:MAG: protein TolQ [Bdellovibrionia bacterium]